MARTNNTTSLLLLPALLFAVSACGQAAEENINPLYGDRKSVV